MARERKDKESSPEESRNGAARAANPKAKKPSHLLQQAIILHAVGTNRPEPIVISTTLPTVQPFSLEGFSAPSPT